jgi:hypothetical protein
MQPYAGKRCTVAKLAMRDIDALLDRLDVDDDIPTIQAQFADLIQNA